jgi:hypothetical protein
MVLYVPVIIVIMSSFMPITSILLRKSANKEDNGLSGIQGCPSSVFARSSHKHVREIHFE